MMRIERQGRRMRKEEGMWRLHQLEVEVPG
jgi:hypothetical protein